MQSVSHKRAIQLALNLNNFFFFSALRQSRGTHLFVAHQTPNPKNARLRCVPVSVSLSDGSEFVAEFDARFVFPQFSQQIYVPRR